MPDPGQRRLRELGERFAAVRAAQDDQVVSLQRYTPSARHRAEWFYYRCKVCGHEWKSQRVVPICYGLGGGCLEKIKVETLDPPGPKQEGGEQDG